MRKKMCMYSLNRAAVDFNPNPTPACISTCLPISTTPNNALTNRWKPLGYGSRATAEVPFAAHPRTPGVAAAAAAQGTPRPGTHHSPVGGPFAAAAALGILAPCAPAPGMSAPFGPFLDSPAPFAVDPDNRVFRRSQGIDGVLGTAPGREVAAFLLRTPQRGSWGWDRIPV